MLFHHSFSLVPDSLAGRNQAKSVHFSPEFVPDRHVFQQCHADTPLPARCHQAMGHYPGLVLPVSVLAIRADEIVDGNNAASIGAYRHVRPAGKDHCRPAVKLHPDVLTC